MTQRTRKARAGRTVGAVAGDVTGWRREQLERAGFDRRLAGRLAASAVDLHALINLVEHGCSPHLAERIMAPLEAEDNWC
jgi:hypothetical protein